jgi:hypothetical protein
MRLRRHPHRLFIHLPGHTGEAGGENLIRDSEMTKDHDLSQIGRRAWCLPPPSPSVWPHCGQTRARMTGEVIVDRSLR